MNLLVFRKFHHDLDYAAKDISQMFCDIYRSREWSIKLFQVLLNKLHSMPLNDYNDDSVHPMVF